MRHPLAIPWLYRLSQSLAGGAGRATFVREYVRARSGDRVLDVGCGTGDLLETLPAGVEYVGFDLSERYVEAARARYGARGTFHCRPVGREAVAEPGGFDLAVACGVLHHLDDGAAGELMELARRALRPGGRLVTLDPCRFDGQTALRRFVVSLDRGRHVRAPERYRELAGASLSEVRLTVIEDLIRLPYTHVVLECLNG